MEGNGRGWFLGLRPQQPPKCLRGKIWPHIWNRKFSQWAFWWPQRPLQPPNGLGGRIWSQIWNLFVCWDSLGLFRTFFWTSLEELRQLASTRVADHSRQEGVNFVSKQNVSCILTGMQNPLKWGVYHGILTRAFWDMATLTAVFREKILFFVIYHATGWKLRGIWYFNFFSKFHNMGTLTFRFKTGKNWKKIMCLNWQKYHTGYMV